jgi:hypothetical protein
MQVKKSQKIEINQFLLETFTNGRRHSRLHLDKVSNFLNETLIIPDFLKNNSDQSFVAQG